MWAPFNAYNSITAPTVIVYTVSHSGVCNCVEHTLWSRRSRRQEALEQQLAELERLVKDVGAYRAGLNRFRPPPLRTAAPIDRRPPAAPPPTPPWPATLRAFRRAA